LWNWIGRVTVLTGNRFDGSVVAGFSFDLKFQKNDNNLKNSSLLNQVEKKEKLRNVNLKIREKEGAKNL